MTTAPAIRAGSSRLEWLGAARAAALPAAPDLQSAVNQAAQPIRHGPITPRPRKINQPRTGTPQPGRCRQARYRRRRRRASLQRSRANAWRARSYRDAVRPGVVQIPTGAWYDPATPGERSLDKHGNPNVLTARSSDLAAGAGNRRALLPDRSGKVRRLPTAGHRLRSAAPGRAAKNRTRQPLDPDPIQLNRITV